MIELLFTACLATAPENCQQQSLLFTDQTPMSCMMGAQPILAQWINEHPAYTVEGWKCQNLRTAEHDA